jgi:hypothetical protein
MLDPNRKASGIAVNYGFNQCDPIFGQPLIYTHL